MPFFILLSIKTQKGSRFQIIVLEFKIPLFGAVFNFQRGLGHSPLHAVFLSNWTLTVATIHKTFTPLSSWLMNNCCIWLYCIDLLSSYLISMWLRSCISQIFSSCWRYKIYAEGYAWSVSLKYIVSCGSLTLIITPQYEDFFSRGLIPRVNYWPISPNAICPSIKSAVDWAQGHQSEVRVDC